MVLVIDALIALLVLLLVLKLSQRLTLRLKVLAGVSLSRQPQKSCPHLGLAADPFSHDDRPADDHRCYLWMQRDRIDLVHQKGFCLTSAHHKCPWLMVRRPDGPPPLRQRLPRLAGSAPRHAWGLAATVAWLASRIGRTAVALASRIGRTAVAGGRMAGLMGARAAAACAGWLRRKGLVAVPRMASVLTAAGRFGFRALVWVSRGGWWIVRGLAGLIRKSVVLVIAAARARRARAVLPVSPVTPAASAAQVVHDEPVLVEAIYAASLSAIEELIAEGLATLDRGQETLAYHIFAKATDQRAPRGAPAEQYQDLMKRAWFWRAKTAETVAEVVHSLEQALHLEPGNLQMQAQLAWAKQRLEREHKLEAGRDQAPVVPAAALSQYAIPRARKRGLGPALGDAIRVVGGLAALVLAVLWMTTALAPSLGRALVSLPPADQTLIQRLVLTINASALPGHGHLPLPMANYDLGLSIPFVLAFLFVFTARGLVDGDAWARRGALFLAALGAWVCAVAVNNPDAGRLGLALCIGIILAAVVGRFDAPKVLPIMRSSY